MEKFLQTCFLALLCLAGSSSSAQSKVADSPGADFLHRSGLSVSPHSGDAHRGGETLSDIFLKEETASLRASARSDVSGHPSPKDQKSIPVTSDTESLDSCFLCLESSDSLVDQHLDPGAGEGSYVLQPTPVTVFLVHRIPASAGNLVVDLWDAEMYGLENFDNHQRMEVAPMKAHLLTGLMPGEERGYRFRTPTISGPSILRLSFGATPVIRDYRVSPGDSVMIQVNQQSSAITFSGPSSYKFRLQKELQEVLSTSVQETDIALPFVSDDGYRTFLADPENNTAWDTISRSFGRKTSPVVAGRFELEFIKSIDYRKWESEANLRVEYYQNWVSEADRMAIKAGILGRLGYIHVGRLQGGYDRIVQLDQPQIEREFEDYISQYADEFAEDIPIEIALQVPSFRNFLLSKSKLSADLNGRSFLEQVQGEYPSAVADRLAIQFLSDYRRRIPDFESQANELLARIADPSLKAELEIMLGKFGMGSKVISFDWLGIGGKRIQTDEFKDKVVLMDFWISGCGACKAFHEKILSPLISKYADHPKVEIISVSGDRKPDYWLKQKGTLNVPEAGYTPAYAEQEDGENPFLSHYNIQSFPQWMIIREGGSLLNLGRVPATLEEAEGLIERALSKPTNQSNSL